MKLNLDEYKAHREPVKLTLATRGDGEFKSVSAMYAATGACPIFVVYLHIGELIGYNEWLMDRLHAMAKFYDYTDIIGEATIDMKQFEVVK
jgi:hypothetical protein